MRRLVLVVALCAVATACGGKGNPTEPSSSTGSPSSSSGSGQATPVASAPAPGNSNNAEAEVEGTIQALPPTTAPLTFKVAGRTVITGASTVFKEGDATRTFADLKLGMTVEVKGTASGGDITATRVEIEEQENEPAEVEVEGVVSNLSGPATSFQFSIGSRLIKGDTNTKFSGDANTPASFTDLKNGVEVQVQGRQMTGFVQAGHIEIEKENEPPQPPQNPEVSIDGMLKTIVGAVPMLTLMLNTTPVHTTSATIVQRSGNMLTLAALQVGQTLEVEGTRRTDGSIDAKKITIEDAENENEDNEVEVEGTMTLLTGTCPTISFTVSGVSFKTSASTRFDDTACAAFKNGDKVEVRGTKPSSGPVLVTRLRRKS